MHDVDLEALVKTLDGEIRTSHPEWLPRVDAGATRQRSQLWAGGYLLTLDLTEDCLEPGAPGEGGRKYDKIRMAVLWNSREPMDVSTWVGSSPHPVKVKFWKSVSSGGQIRWLDEGPTEITLEQVFLVILQEFTRVIEEDSH